jgi:hypothetical protein
MCCDNACASTTLKGIRKRQQWLHPIPHLAVMPLRLRSLSRLPAITSSKEAYNALTKRSSSVVRVKGPNFSPANSRFSTRFIVSPALHRASTTLTTSHSSCLPTLILRSTPFQQIHSNRLLARLQPRADFSPCSSVSIRVQDIMYDVMSFLLEFRTLPE